MKKATSILLVIALILTVFVSCNGDVDERLFEDHEHYYEIKSDGHWECIRPNCNLPNKLLAETDEPYITVVVDGQPVKVIPLTSGITDKAVSSGKVTVSGTDITYTNTSETAQEVVIRTNGGKLTVNAPADTVKHYGTATIVTIEQVSPSSYYELGSVKFMDIANGRLVIANTEETKIERIFLTATADEYNNIILATMDNAALPEIIQRQTVSNPTGESNKKLVATIQQVDANGVENETKTEHIYLYGEKTAYEQNKKYTNVSDLGELVLEATTGSKTSSGDDNADNYIEQTEAGKEVENVEAAKETLYVCSIVANPKYYDFGGKYYSVQEAIDAIHDYDSQVTIDLLRTATENVTIPEGRSIKLATSNDGSITFGTAGKYSEITNNGTLTLNGTFNTTASPIYANIQNTGLVTWQYGCRSISGNSFERATAYMINVTGGKLEMGKWTSCGGKLDVDELVFSNGLLLTGDVKVRNKLTVSGSNAFYFEKLSVLDSTILDIQSSINLNTTKSADFIEANKTRFKFEDSPTTGYKILNVDTVEIVGKTTYKNFTFGSSSAVYSTINGDEVKILADQCAFTTDEGSNGYPKISKNITINLNGYTLKDMDVGGVNRKNCGFKINTDGAVLIKNGTFICDTYNYPILIESCGALTVEGVSFNLGEGYSQPFNITNTDFTGTITFTNCLLNGVAYNYSATYVNGALQK